MRKAVIDVGSNSVLLLVEEWVDGNWRQVYEETAVTALGEGTKATGLLSDRSIEATLQAIRTQWRSAQERGATDVRAAATMAARIARNTDVLLARASDQGTPLVVLSGEDEARLGFQAVASDPCFQKYDHLAVVDPGGHSTELITAVRAGGAFERRFIHSFSLGTLGLKSEVIPSESPSPAEVIAASGAIDAALAEQPVEPALGPVVVLGATGTNLISIREGLETWDPERVHGAYLMFEEISRAVGWMMPMTDAERRAIKGMEPGREKTIHIGALILERFLHALSVEGCFVSCRGWRHAYLESGA